MCFNFIFFFYLLSAQTALCVDRLPLIKNLDVDPAG